MKDKEAVRAPIPAPRKPKDDGMSPTIMATLGQDKTRMGWKQS